MKKSIAISLVLCLGLIAYAVAIFASAEELPTPLKTESFENLQEDLTGSIFYNVLFSKADSSDDTKDFVINGDKSLKYSQLSGYGQFAISHEGLFTFEDDRVYMINFLVKFHDPLAATTQFLFYATTNEVLDTAVPAMYFQIVEGNFLYTQTTNTTGVELGNVVDMGDGLYSITLRYKTIAEPANPGSWNMRFALNGAGNLSLDDISIWEVQSDTDPADYHPLVPVESESSSTSENSSEESSDVSSQEPSDPSSSDVSSEDPSETSSEESNAGESSKAGNEEQVDTGDSIFIVAAALLLTIIFSVAAIVNKSKNLHIN